MRFYRSTDTNHQSRNIGSVFLVMCNLMDGLVPVSSLLLVRLLSSSATGSPCVPSVVTDVRWWCGCSVSAIPGSSCLWCSTIPRCVYLWRGSSCNCVSPRCPVCFALRSVSRRCCLCPLPPACRPLNDFPPIPFQTEEKPGYKAHVAITLTRIANTYSMILKTSSLLW